MIEILHLHSADCTYDLQTGMLGLLQGCPDLLGAFFRQSDGNSNDAVCHSGCNGLDAQRVNAGILNAFQFNDTDTQLVQQLGQFDFFLKGQAEAIGHLFHGYIGEFDRVHIMQLLVK